LSFCTPSGTVQLSTIKDWEVYSNVNEGWDESSVVHCIPTDWIKLFILAQVVVSSWMLVGGITSTNSALEE